MARRRRRVRLVEAIEAVVFWAAVALVLLAALVVMWLFVVGLFLVGPVLT